MRINLARIARRVADLCGMDQEGVVAPGWPQQKVKAPSLLCHWAVREAKIALRTLASSIVMINGYDRLATE